MLHVSVDVIDSVDEEFDETLFPWLLFSEHTKELQIFETSFP